MLGVNLMKRRPTALVRGLSAVAGAEPGRGVESKAPATITLDPLRSPNLESLWPRYSAGVRRRWWRVGRSDLCLTSENTNMNLDRAGKPFQSTKLKDVYVERP